MAKCLGLYVEDNVIKYAKVSKERDDIKIEAFGIEFYEKLDKAIDKIVEETYSQKIPISINLANENYNYFSIFSLLSKADLQKAIKTEFETKCEESGVSPTVFETRYAAVNQIEGEDKVRIIFISENKNEMNRIMQQFKGHKVSCIAPVPMAITNLIGQNEGAIDKENALVVNIEGKTTITTIIENNIQEIDELEEGSFNILSKLNVKENSFAKAYEICKNTTIYTSAGRELQMGEDTDNLDDIMPTIHTIVSHVKKKISTSVEKINKVYITGMGAMINNVDIYFQEYLDDVQCEILRPYFILNTGDISIKDYQEVNTAISLALMGLGEGIPGINFKVKTFYDSLPDWMKIEITTPGPDTKFKNPILAKLFENNLAKPYDRMELILLRVSIGLLILTVVYSGLSALLDKQIDKKQKEAEELQIEISEQINLASSDNEEIVSKTNKYTDMINDLEILNEKIEDRNKTRNAIPNLLNQLMYVIPENSRIDSIQNTSENHILINAQSTKYEQLGYFKSKIELDGILTNVTSSAGTKNNGVVTITIEGDLP